MSEQQEPQQEPQTVLEPLTDPGPPIMLTVKIDADGNGQTRYLMPPSEAVALLRRIADQIEEETRGA